ncbi:MAG: hypothetical protein QXF82_08165, partial [Nitrososphaeria archaeon]
MIFGQAILYFSLTLLPLYIVLLLLSDKYDKENVRDITTKNAKLILLVEGLFFLFLIQTNTSKLNVEYKMLLIMIAAFIIFSLSRYVSRKVDFYFFIAVVLYHILLLYNPPLPVIFIDERYDLIAHMNNLGKLSPNIPLTVHYAPFPMGLFMYYILSSIFGVEAIFFNYWVWSTIFIFVYDLVLYLLIKKITNDWRATVFVIFILST